MFDYQDAFQTPFDMNVDVRNTSGTGRWTGSVTVNGAFNDDVAPYPSDPPVAVPP
jgi:hypothetical protein